MQKLHKPNSFFGWLNTFKILPTNIYLGRRSARPISPPIIPNPTVTQTLQNWNLADTGALISFYLIGLFVSRRVVVKMHPATYIEVRRSSFFFISNMMLSVAIFAGLMNSSNRLNGFTPNGLTWDLPEVERIKKFDYTSDMIKRNPFLRFLIPIEL